MKTKLLLTLLFVIIISSSSSVYNLVDAHSTRIMDTQKQIDLKGALTESTLRSFSIPVEVFQSSNSILINYLEDLSNISIEITDGLGQLVYLNKVNTVTGDFLMIDISDWEKGSYTISFRNSSGGCISGDFDIV